MKIVARADGDQIRIIYSDDGYGMSAEVQSHIFDPFFTTRMGTGGSGLGMIFATTWSVARSVVASILPAQLSKAAPLSSYFHVVHQWQNIVSKLVFSDVLNI
ncbi:MAG: HAMP domain-containing histidine kinase [Cytophaga sp.]|nr:HAMP domain-containing histidine kinase [Undibacterium sp.]